MIHIVTGPPCAGKSTYVRENAKDGDLRVDYDLIATALGSKNSHSAEGIIRKAAFEAREGAIRTAVKKPGQESWIIHTSPSEEHLKVYEEAGADIIELDPGYDVCMERAKQDERPQQTFDGIEKWYSGRKGKAMKYLYKNFSVKADAETGTVSGYFSTYDRIPDSYGDIVAPGAFTDTIKARKESGHPFPLCWNHDLDQIIGKVDKIEDTEKGPLVTATFFDTPLAQEKREIVKSGVVYQFSFAYDIEEAKEVTLEDGTKANELRKLNLYEVSVVPIPANPRAEVTDIKSEEPEVKEAEPEVKDNTLGVVKVVCEYVEKSGRRNSKADADKLEQAISLIRDVLGQIEDTEEAEPEDGEDEAKANEASEEPEQSNPRKDALLDVIEKIKQEV